MSMLHDERMPSTIWFLVKDSSGLFFALACRRGERKSLLRRADYANRNDEEKMNSREFAKQISLKDNKRDFSRISFTFKRVLEDDEVR